MIVGCGIEVCVSLVLRQGVSERVLLIFKIKLRDDFSVSKILYFIIVHEVTFFILTAFRILLFIVRRIRRGRVGIRGEGPL